MSGGAGARRCGRIAAVLAAAAAALGAGGCGLDVNLGDVFVLTRTEAGATLTLVVNQSGTLSCNGAAPKTISSAMLIQARDLSVDLAADATAKLTIPRSPGTVQYFRIVLQQGTVAFPDRAAATHKTLAQAELFATQAAQQVCGLTG
ncbi:MAG: hypothetical protein ABSH51_18805 [Solirubrobacteraceae bacterium]